MSNNLLQQIKDNFNPRLILPKDGPKRRPLSERMGAAYDSEREAPDGCVRLVNLLRVWIPEVIVLEQVTRFVQTRLFWWGVAAGAVAGASAIYLALAH